MFIKALLAYLLLPGIFAGILPLYLGLSDPAGGSGSIFGLVAVVIGLILHFWCVRDFYVSGKGTLAPWDPPKNMVSTGLYQFTRNPMYLAVLLIILGLAIVFESSRLFLYLGVMAIIFYLRVFFNEERWLEAQFGQEWAQYKSDIPRWMPRIKPFNTCRASKTQKKK